MRFIGDFHIHSHYSIATSKNLVPEHLDYWAMMKGIKVVGTGDSTHPGWLNELREKLEPAEPGLYKLKDEYRLDSARDMFSADEDPRFILTSEISSIYKKRDRVRKVHNLIFSPDFETAEKIQQKLSKIGNILSDGRPILGLDSRNLLEIALTCSENIFFVPCHIWTPWFSALGAKSGFDSIDECYDDLSGYISAVETGLSSDPPMNRMCSFLDKYTLISNSDAHSPEKLGREANIFDTELSYEAIVRAIREQDSRSFLGTVEFFPQEGKYHHDGHRKCQISWDPVQTIRNKEICPVCSKKVTVGVMNRVMQLADREKETAKKACIPFHSLIPLKEILSEIIGVGVNSKQITKAYNSLIQKAGSEFAILMDLPEEELKKAGGDIIAEAVKRMRKGEVHIKEGFDGEFGRIKVFDENEKSLFDNQGALFKEFTRKRGPKKTCKKQTDLDVKGYQNLLETKSSPKSETQFDSLLAGELNDGQQKAVSHFKGPALITAGPGTGKTRVLTRRIANLINEKGVLPENILAVTFTNKAVEEMKKRLNILLEDESVFNKLNVYTFHGLGFEILKQNIHLTGRDEMHVIDETDKKFILNKKLGCEKERVNSVSCAITSTKQDLKEADDLQDRELAENFAGYEAILKEHNLFDLDDLIYTVVKLFNRHPHLAAEYREKFQWIMIDEYQDINFAQYSLIRMLMPEDNSNLYVIGDSNQAIYGFRGADVRFIRSFIDDYPEASVYSLNKSYRCSDHILKASSSVIGDGREKPSLLNGVLEGVKIRIVENPTDRSEAEFVARTIEKMIGGLSFFSMYSRISEGNRDSEIESLSDFAVLCRVKSQINALQKAFHDHNIPYQTIEELPFFKKEPVKSVIDVIKLSANPSNEFLKDILGERKILGPEWPEDALALSKNKSVKGLTEEIIDRYFSSLEDHSFKELLDLAGEFGSNVGDFLKFAALGSGVDVFKPNTEQVNIMTLHSAKGLEFDCVFIVGCEDGLLPYSLFESQKADYEEERRLLYVGMTRAKKFLFLSRAGKRFLFGKEYRLARSPFIDNIERELIELSRSEYKKKEVKEDNQLMLF